MEYWEGLPEVDWALKPGCCMGRVRFGGVWTGAYEVGLRKLESLYANVTVRRIFGIGRSAQLKATQVAAEIKSVRNLFFGQFVLIALPVYAHPQ